MTKAAQFVLKYPALAFAIIACGLIAISTPIALFQSIGNDFFMYYRVANEPLSMAYIPYSDLPFPYLPTMMLWIEPLAFLPMWATYLLWVAMSALAFGAACRPYVTRSATVLALASPPLVFCYLTGQVSGLLAAIILWACGTPQRVFAGIAFGVVASIKPQLVIMAPMLMLMTKDWRALVAAGVTFISIVTASILAYGLDTWFVWLASLDDFHEMVRNEGVFSVAVTPAAMAEYAGFNPLPVLAVSAAFGAYLTYQCRKQPPLVLSAAIGCGSLCAAPYALIHDLAVVVPFLAWSVFQGRVIAALAIPAAINPVPVLLTALGLIRIAATSSADADASAKMPEKPNND